MTIRDRREARQRRREARRTVADEIANCMDNHPDCTQEECELHVRQELEQIYGEMPAWLAMLIEFLLKLLPLIFTRR